MTALTTPSPLAGKVAVVTGAARGLGRAFAQRLAAEGATVATVDCRQAADEASRHSNGALSIVADVSRLDDAHRIADTVVSELGGVDILVNNGGRWKATPVDGSRDQALADYSELIGTNTRGPFLLQRAVVGSMIERGGGDVVNLSTDYVLPPRPAGGTNPPQTDLYNASKWALNGFTQAWALALRKHGIRVNALAMGATDTPMQRSLFGPDGPPADVLATWMAPAEQAQLLVDLLAEGPDGRTGETIGSWIGEPIALPPRRARGEDIR